MMDGSATKHKTYTQKKKGGGKEEEEGRGVCFFRRRNEVRVKVFLFLVLVPRLPSVELGGKLKVMSPAGTRLWCVVRTCMCVSYVPKYWSYFPFSLDRSRLLRLGDRKKRTSLRRRNRGTQICGRGVASAHVLLACYAQTRGETITTCCTGLLFSFFASKTPSHARNNDSSFPTFSPLTFFTVFVHANSSVRLRPSSKKHTSSYDLSTRVRTECKAKNAGEGKYLLHLEEICTLRAAQGVIFQKRKRGERGNFTRTRRERMWPLCGGEEGFLSFRPLPRGTKMIIMRQKRREREKEEEERDAKVNQQVAFFGEDEHSCSLARASLFGQTFNGEGPNLSPLLLDWASPLGECPSAAANPFPPPPL